MKRIILVILAALLLAAVFNYFSGTTITINGRQVTDVGQYIATYLGLLLLAAVLVILIPSTLILVAALLIVFGIFCMLFLPALPLAFLLLPGLVFAGIVYLIYRAVKKKK